MGDWMSQEAYGNGQSVMGIGNEVLFDITLHEKTLKVLQVGLLQ